MIYGIKITTNGETVNLNLIPDLKTLQQSVGGRIQAVDIFANLTMWCNEEGKILNLPHNPCAQFIWDSAFGMHTDYIVGDVVLTGGADDEGEITALSPEDAFMLQKTVEMVCKFAKVESGRSLTLEA